MEYDVRVLSTFDASIELLVAPLDASGFSKTLQWVDQQSGGLIQRMQEDGDLPKKIGHVRLLSHLNALPVKRLLIVHCGESIPLSFKKSNEVIEQIAANIQTSGATQACLFPSDFLMRSCDEAQTLKHLLRLFENQAYQFTTYLSKRETPAPCLLSFCTQTNQASAALNESLKEGLALSKGLSLIKNLVNEPPNHCTPQFLADSARSLDGQYETISVDVLEKDALEKLGMGCLLGVAAGSSNPPKLVVLKYHPKKLAKQGPFVFVGKGVSFDTGGHSLKPAASMAGMKFDMAGAATVLGIMIFAAELDLPFPLVGLMPCVENTPGPTAYRPDDILRSYSGKTVEVLNTDAEGRLILADALTYAEQFHPEAVIDMATLTGACIVALGDVHSALLSNNPALRDELLEASVLANDKAWALPFDEAYDELLKSDVADMANIGGPHAGTITAAAFLNRFTEAYPWAHLDIAGTASKGEGRHKAPTGRPLPLIAEFLLKRAKTHA